MSCTLINKIFHKTYPGRALFHLHCYRRKHQHHLLPTSLVCSSSDLIFWWLEFWSLSPHLRYEGNFHQQPLPQEPALRPRQLEIIILQAQLIPLIILTNCVGLALQLDLGRQLARVHLLVIFLLHFFPLINLTISFSANLFFFSNFEINFSLSPLVIRMSLHPNWLSISSATDVMEYKVDLTTARSEDKADQYSSIVIMTGCLLQYT